MRTAQDHPFDLVVSDQSDGAPSFDTPPAQTLLGLIAASTVLVSDDPELVTDSPGTAGDAGLVGTLPRQDPRGSA